MRRKKLLRCIGTVNPAAGGIIESVLQSSRALGEAGVSVEIASLDSPQDPFVGSVPVPFHPLGTSGLGYGFTKRFSPWIRENRHHYDAVIVEGIWQYHSFGAFRGLRGGDTPYFVFPHGMLDPHFRRTYPLKHIKKLIYWQFAEYPTLRHSQAVVFTCEEERRLAKDGFWPYDFNEAVVRLGTAAPKGDAENQIETFYERFPDLRRKRLILFLGRLHEKKGCDLLINALKTLVDAPSGKSDLPWHLMMAGPCADASYLEGLTHMAEPLGPSISFPGMLSGDLKWGACHAAEAFILPSHQENFGMAVIEALACGLPVLITDKVNIWREIVEDEAGFVESDDLPGTLRLLQRWSALSKEERSGMRKTAGACFRRRFEISRTAEGLMGLLSL